MANVPPGVVVGNSRAIELPFASKVKIRNGKMHVRIGAFPFVGSCDHFILSP